MKTKIENLSFIVLISFQFGIGQPDNHYDYTQYGACKGG